MGCHVMHSGALENDSVRRVRRVSLSQGEKTEVEQLIVCVCPCSKQSQAAQLPQEERWNPMKMKVISQSDLFGSALSENLKPRAGWRGRETIERCLRALLKTTLDVSVFFFFFLPPECCNIQRKLCKGTIVDQCTRSLVCSGEQGYHAVQATTTQTQLRIYKTLYIYFNKKNDCESQVSYLQLSNLKLFPI